LSLIYVLYREDFYFVDWFHFSLLHGNCYATGCKVHMNLTDESACLISDNISNKVNTIHRSQEVYYNAVPLYEDIPHTAGRCSDLFFEALLQEYLQFLHKNSLFYLILFRG
jgi:hypothetical protein